MFPMLLRFFRPLRRGFQTIFNRLEVLPSSPVIFCPLFAKKIQYYVGV